MKPSSITSRFKIIKVAAEDHQMAKVLASMRGLQLKEYFGMRVRQDELYNKNQVLHCGPFLEEDRGRKRR